MHAHTHIGDCVWNLTPADCIFLRMNHMSYLILSLLIPVLQNHKEFPSRDIATAPRSCPLQEIPFQRALIQKYQSPVNELIRLARNPFQYFESPKKRITPTGVIFQARMVFCAHSSLPRSADPTQRVHPPKHSIKDMQMYTWPQAEQSLETGWSVNTNQFPANSLLGQPGPRGAPIHEHAKSLGQEEKPLNSAPAPLLFSTFDTSVFKPHLSQTNRGPLNSRVFMQSTSLMCLPCSSNRVRLVHSLVHLNVVWA